MQTIDIHFTFFSNLYCDATEDKTLISLVATRVEVLGACSAFTLIKNRT